MKRDLLMVIGIAIGRFFDGPCANHTSGAERTSGAACRAAKQAAATTSMRQQLSDNLTKAGYTDVKVMPEAFIIKANNKAGEPVIMFLSPYSMTVFTAKDPKGQDAKTAPTAAQ